MGELLRRMIRCGIPKRTALQICQYFSEKREVLERYVSEVEKACYGKVEAI